MNASKVLAFLVSIILGLNYAKGIRVGGWTTQNPWGNVKYLEMARFALKQQQLKTGFSSRHAALWLFKVETQVVSGINYKISFKIARRPCLHGHFPSSTRTCKLANFYAISDCNTTIYNQPWTKTIKVTSFRCKKRK
uniref:Putative tick cistatins 1 n=1 Tax=Amblyomma triste TaxID=251400 RepID=A0A023GC69_AMBTT